MRKYGKILQSKGGFSIVEVVNENGGIIGYVVLSPDGSEIFCASLEEASSIFDIHVSNEAETDNGFSLG